MCMYIYIYIHCTQCTVYRLLVLVQHIYCIIIYILCIDCYLQACMGVMSTVTQATGRSNGDSRPSRDDCVTGFIGIKHNPLIS